MNKLILNTFWIGIALTLLFLGCPPQSSSPGGEDESIAKYGQEFQGKIAKSYDESEEWWPTPPKPPSTPRRDARTFPEMRTRDSSRSSSTTIPSTVSDEAVSGTTSRPMASSGADVDRARAMTARGWRASARLDRGRGPARVTARGAIAHARAGVIVGPSLARSARWVECEGEAYPQRCEATILNSSSFLTSLNEKTAAAQRLMCGHLQMVDVIKHGITTGRYKLHLLCLPVELSSNHLKVAQCETS